MLTLGIETSCDDTSIAVIKDGVEILSSLVSSQIEIHRRFGGVVPEVASRKHLEAFPPLLQEALGKAAVALHDVDQIAVTAGPGLLGALLVGLSSAKALAWSMEKPMIPVNHLEAHLAAGFLAAGKAQRYPYLGLIVSGGHSNLVMAGAVRHFEILGRTVDDAPGELFDKAARFLGLGYPGGPEIQRVGAQGDPKRYALPRPMKHQGYGFSFSGLKTAVINLAKKEGDHLVLADLCASLQDAVADTLCGKVEAAIAERRPPIVILAGGVAANQVLRDRMKNVAERTGVELLIPPLNLCTDNAAMIAAAGYFSAEAWVGKKTLLINARADWPMGGGPETLLEEPVLMGE